MQIWINYLNLDSFNVKIKLKLSIFHSNTSKVGNLKNLSEKDAIRHKFKNKFLIYYKIIKNVPFAFIPFIFISNISFHLFFTSRKHIAMQFEINGFHMRVKMSSMFTARARVLARLIAFYTAYLFSRRPCDDTDGSSGNMERDREARR